MGKTKRNPTIELEVCPPDWTTFKAALAHYPAPEGIEDFGRDQGALMMWVSDVWAMQARQPPRFFSKGEDGVWRRKVEPAKEIRVVGAVMVRYAHIFAARRAPHKSLAGQWEFPGGKVEAWETPKQALAREMREEFGLEVEVGDWLAGGEAMVDGVRIILDVYATTITGGEFKLTDHDASGWFDVGSVMHLEWAKVDQVVLPKIQERLAANLTPIATNKTKF